MVAQVAAMVAEWQPVVERYAKQGNRHLAGRVALLCGLFGLFLLTAVWFGAEPLPRSAWQELGLATEAPVLRRVYARDAEALDRIFADNDYRLAAVMNGAPVPRLSVTALPRDMESIADSEARKRLFLRSLLPLVLQANAELSRARAKVISALDARAAGRLGATDALWLDSVAEWYGAAPGDAADLLSRIDAVPPSLALAQAAQESGWGTSRFAIRANALFGQRSWGDGAEGLKPAAAERRDFKVRGFPDLMSAVRAYLHNLNSHRAYQDLRQRRARARALGTPLHALNLVGGLKSYSEEGQSYVLALSELITSNDLQALDGVTLSPRR
ncbi:glucosaminidase domain-containing protein [Pelagibius marinus]|uniref:glucosaminidase domain-containing protein n=1 Tax=Pelagibius marinus TaxID=2762760 RepID=UPI0018730A24|nr:glucosaminidase domain-containing protein [Pelagibius marinus]